MTVVGGVSVGFLVSFIVAVATKDRSTDSKQEEPLPDYHFSPENPQSTLLQKYSDLHPELSFHKGIPLYSPRYAHLFLDEGVVDSTEFSEELKLKLKTLTNSKNLTFHTSLWKAQSATRDIADTQGKLNPLLLAHEGLLVNDGGTGWLGADLRGEAIPKISYELYPIFRMASHTSAYSGNRDLLIHKGYLKYRLHELEILAGKDTVRWGHGEFGGLQLSGTAEPFTLMSLGNTEPVILPWFLKYLGPFRLHYFLTYLEEKREHPYSLLHGAKITTTPHPRWEVGLSQVLQFGGEGASGSPLVIILGDYFANTPANRNFSISNRLKIPELGIEPYLELMWEDCCHPITLNPRDTLHILGIYFPRLDSEGRWDLNFEWARTNEITYRHHEYTSGYFFKERGIGYPLGPDGNGFYASLRHFYSSSLFFKLTTAFENRTDYPASTRPSENRYRLHSSTTWECWDHAWLSADIGYERAQNFGFESGRGLNNYLVGMSLSVQ